MLNVYFTASTSANGQFHTHYRRIITLLKKMKLTLVSGEQIVNKTLLEKDALTPKTEIFKRERQRIDKADFLVAEVTKPSTGVGGEIVYGLIQRKPVLALVFKENEDALSPMVAGNPSDNLYLEHYDFDNLHLILKHFLQHVRQLKTRKGKLIVIEGGDGSGKTTQADLLITYLSQKKVPVKLVDFPRYYSSFHGKTVGRFLRGEFGPLQKVSPYLAALAYALDRASVKEEMDFFLAKGGVIIANRYATSTMAHQTARLKTEPEQKAFLTWVYELEYKIHKIPKEDLVIYLFVPWQIGVDLTEQKGKRTYLKGGVDIAETDMAHRMAAEKMYLSLVKQYSHWIKIDCVSNDRLLSPLAIHNQIVIALKQHSIYL